MAEQGLAIDRHNDISIVTFGGATVLDIATSESLYAQLLALAAGPPPPKVVVDLSAVRFMASRILGVLVEMTRKAQALRGKVVVCGLHEDVRAVMRTMRLHRILALAADCGQAITVLGEVKE